MPAPRPSSSPRRASSSPEGSSGTASTPSTGGADLGAWRRASRGPRSASARGSSTPATARPGRLELLERMADYLGDLEEAVRPLALRPSLSARDVASLRKAVARKHRGLAPPRRARREPARRARPPPRPPRRTASDGRLAAKGEWRPGRAAGRGSRWRAARRHRPPPSARGSPTRRIARPSPFFRTASGRPG